MPRTCCIWQLNWNWLRSLRGALAPIQLPSFPPGSRLSARASLYSVYTAQCLVMARVVTARKQSSVNKLTRQSSVHSLMKAEDERESSNSRSFTARSSRFEGGRSSTYSKLTKSKLSQKLQNRIKVCFSSLILQWSLQSAPCASSSRVH